MINKVNQVQRGWKHYFGGIGYPRAIFFRINGFVVNRFYRWHRRLSQRLSKYLSRGAYEKLRQAGLEYLPRQDDKQNEGAERSVTTEPCEGKLHARNRRGAAG
ncbi:hypothetical protein D5R81_16835 [Parashewanella spongiae]|uniref:Group II intron maturase-specific domain-containing protein n=1 Tax=Parashewanella spongiae TaxID=342950 RepID=A0A3A6TPH0_9GAMM|nr:hypothetical protein D5R81_16835 [Parashewanella spongiae]